VFNLELFAPTSIVYKLLEFILKNPKLTFSHVVLLKLDQLLNLTFGLFEVYKQNSKYFIITVHSSSQSKQEEDKAVRRMSVLFTDLLDLLVAFCCQYLMALSRL
jgi:hypothetical protein